NADFVPQQGVTLVAPTAVPVTPGGAVPTRTLAPPKGPVWPPAPNTPANDTPGSLGGALSGPVGGALLLVAALAAVLSIIPPWLTSRAAMAVAAPVEWRRRLSLERPGYGAARAPPRPGRDRRAGRARLEPEEAFQGEGK